MEDVSTDDSRVHALVDDLLHARGKSKIAINLAEVDALGVRSATRAVARVQVAHVSKLKGHVPILSNYGVSTYVVAAV